MFVHCVQKIVEI